VRRDPTLTLTPALNPLPNLDLHLTPTLLVATPLEEEKDQDED
jgi:hypothetical protein